MIAIRPATQPDIPQLADLVRQQVEYQLQLDSHLILNPNADWIKYVSTRLNQQDVEVLVADKDGNIVGYTDIRVVQQRNTTVSSRLKAAIRWLLRLIKEEPPSILKPKRYGFIDDIYVAPSLRNSPVGVGVRLYKSAISWFELQKVSHIECTVTARNEGAQAFMEKFGFRTVAMLMRNDLLGDKN